MISIKCKNYEEGINKMNENNDLMSWLNTNLLKLNANKSTAMLLTSSERKRKQILTEYGDKKIKINGLEIEFSETVKYLGILIDSTLKFTKYIKSICKTISYKIQYLFRCGKYTSVWTRKIIYNTIIKPHFEYCETLLLGCNKTDLKKLQVLQNRAMRAIQRCTYNEYTVKELLEKFSYLSVQQHIMFRTLIHIYMKLKII